MSPCAAVDVVEGQQTAHSVHRKSRLIVAAAAAGVVAVIIVGQETNGIEKNGRHERIVFRELTSDWRSSKGKLLANLNEAGS